MKGIYAQQKKMYFLCKDAKAIPIDTVRLPKDQKVAELLDLYHDSLQKRMTDTLIINAMPLSKALPESTLGNLVADAARSVFSIRKIDIGMVNYGSIGVEYIAPRALLRKDLYEIIPHESKLILVAFSGKELQILCDTIAQHKGIPISGLSFEIANNKAINVHVNNIPLHPNLMYTIALNEYLYKSKMMQEIVKQKKYEMTGISLRNALQSFLARKLQQQKTLQMILENRISYAE